MRAGGQAVEKLPPGQIGSLLQQVAGRLPGLAALEAGQQQAPLPWLLLEQCLASLPLSSSTALPAASAVRALVQQHLAQPLGAQLRQSKVSGLQGL